MSRLRWFGWLAVGAITAGWFVAAPHGRPHPGDSPADAKPVPPAIGRLLGPLAGLAADIQWVRVHDAMLRGRGELVLTRAELALDLAPTATDGWLFLGRHLAFDRASEEREPDPQRRLAWVRAALDLARRGEAQAAEPGELAAWRGLVQAKEAEEGDLPWPGGVRALLEGARIDFERAAALGHPHGQSLAEGASRRLAELP